MAHARRMLVLFVATSMACSTGGDGDSAGFTRADSAGITIATNTLDASSMDPVVMVAQEPRLRLGAEAGAEKVMFSFIRGVVRLDDGRIAVANGRPMEIRVFDTAGTFVTRMGRAGQGPGEFQSLSRLVAGRGDTLLAVNLPHFQLLRFTVSNGYLGMSTMPRDSLGQHLPALRLAEGTREFLANGSAIVTARPATAGRTEDEYVAGELHRVQSTAIWISADRSRSVVLGSVGGIQQMFIDIGGGRRTFEIPPSARFTFTALGTRGTRFCMAGNETPEVRCVDQDGRRLIVRWAQDSVPTPADEIERWRVAVREDGRDPRSSPETAERIIAGMKIPATVPPIRGLREDDEGRLFVGGPDLVSPQGLSRHRVFSAEGKLLGIADLPPAGTGEIGKDHFVGVTRDENGIEYVVVYDVHRGG